MDDKEVIIGILAGLVTNFITFLLTRHFTSDAERKAYVDEEKKARSNIAESAIGHLRSTYYAVKQLSLEVMQKQYENSDNAVFNTTLWGIKHGLEQLRLGLQGHMNTWKNELGENSHSIAEINKIMQEDILIGSAPSSRALSNQISSATSPKSPKDKTPDRVLETSGKSSSLLDRMRTTPRQEIAKIIATGDLGALENLVALEAGKNGSINKIVALGGMAALSGSEKAHGILLELFRRRYAEMNASDKNALFTSICQFYVRNDREKEGYPICRELISVIMDDASLTDSNKAHACNQIGMVAYHADEMSDASNWEEKAISMAPDDASYIHNHALTLDKLGDTQHAEEHFLKALELGRYEEPDHIESAIGFYHKHGKLAEASNLLNKLRELDPTKAEIFNLIKELRG